MNIHQPNVMNKVQNTLTSAASLLRHLDAEDWATDIEQTAHSIQTEYNDEYTEYRQSLLHAKQTDTDTYMHMKAVEASEINKDEPNEITIGFTSSNTNNTSMFIIRTDAPMDVLTNLAKTTSAAGLCRLKCQMIITKSLETMGYLCETITPTPLIAFTASNN